MLPPEPDATWAFALGDVDGDGDLDLLVGNADGERLHLNDGFGNFTEATGALPPPIGPFVSTSSLALGDVDGDGDLDCMIGTSYSAVSNRLYLNDGTGTFTDASAQLPSLSDFTRAVALGDVDADGDLDAVVGNSGQSRLYLNDSTGLFTLGPFPTTIDVTQAVALGDVDGDGDLDAYFANHSIDRLFLNDGTGIFSYAIAQIPTAYANTTDVALGDVDGDGDLDALLGQPGSTLTGAQNRLYLNNGAGGFSDVTAQLPAILDITNAVALADVDADGDIDALIGNSGQDRLLLNDGSGVFTDATASLPLLDHGTWDLALGDADADGDLDALFASYGGNNRLYLNDGSGVFANATSPQPRILGDARIVLGDLDGDGDLDAFAGYAGAAGQNRLFLNDGTGVFAEAPGPLPAILDDTRAVALGDVDGDGDLDALVGNSGWPGEPNRLYLNDGSAVFVDATSQLPAFLGGTLALSMGDVDGDGDLDAVIGSGGGRLHLNDGTGVFVDATTQLPYSTGGASSLALGDVDGDGDLDAVIGGGGPGWTGLDRLYLNDGSGVFADASAQLPAILDDTRAVALGDLDGDGDLDLWIGNAGDPDRLYLNDGSGFFSDTTGQIPVILDTTSAVALGDADGDSDLDAFVGNGSSYSFGEQDRLYVNDGTGVFTDATSLLPAIRERTNAIALGDIDGDGDLDALTGTHLGPIRIASNLTRQLARKGVPRVGKPLRLDLHGPAWGSWFLAFSLGTAGQPIPPFGTLRLDPTGIHLASSGLLDGLGRAAALFSVPSTPSLVGATVYWQALVTSPARFTNLEITTLTDL